MNHWIRKNRKSEVLAKWEKTGLLKGLQGYSSSEVLSVALWLEAQRVANEKDNNCNAPHDGWRRISICMIRRLADKLPMDSVTGSLDPLKDWLTFEMVYDPPKWTPNGYINMGNEADYTLEMVDNLAKEINLLICHWNHITVHCFTEENGTLRLNYEPVPTS